MKTLSITGTDQDTFSIGVGDNKFSFRVIEGIGYFRNAAGAWQQLASVSQTESVSVAEWNALTFYVTGQLLTYQNSLLRVKQTHTSGSIINNETANLEKIADFDKLLTLNVDTDSFPYGVLFVDARNILVEGTNTGTIQINLPNTTNISPGHEYVIYNRSNSSVTVANNSGTGILLLTTGEAGSFVSRNQSNEWISAKIQESSSVSGSTGNVPSGAVAMFAGSVPPPAWLECNGSLVFKTDYPDLYAAIGGAYGETDTQFRLPDGRGRFARGWDHGSGNDPDANERADRGDGVAGDNVGTLQEDAIIKHKHPDKGHQHGAIRHRIAGVIGFGEVSLNAYNTLGAVYTNTAVAPGEADLGDPEDSGTGAGTVDISTETRPKNINLMFIIKT